MSDERIEAQPESTPIPESASTPTLEPAPSAEVIPSAEVTPLPAATSVPETTSASEAAVVSESGSASETAPTQDASQGEPASSRTPAKRRKQKSSSVKQSEKPEQGEGSERVAEPGQDQNREQVQDSEQVEKPADAREEKPRSSRRRNKKQRAQQAETLESIQSESSEEDGPAVSNRSGKIPDDGASVIKDAPVPADPAPTAASDEPVSDVAPAADERVMADSGSDTPRDAAKELPDLEPPATRAGEKAPKAQEGSARPQGSTRAARASLKSFDEMNIEELTAQFPRRRRGRPSKKEQLAREAIAAARENPTSELLSRARNAVASALGSPRAVKSVINVDAPKALESDGTVSEQAVQHGAAPVDESGETGARPADAAASGEGGYGARRRRHERRGDGQAPTGQPDQQSQEQSTAQKDGSWQKGQQRQHDNRDNRDQGRQRNRDNRSQAAQGNSFNQQRNRDNRDSRDNRDGRAQQQGYAQNGFNGQNQQQFGKNGRRNKGQRDFVIEPKANRDELEELKVGDLRTKATELGIDPAGLKKPELIDAVYSELVKQEGFFEFKGILDLTNEGFGFIRTKGYLASDKDVYLSASLVRANGLRRGDEVCGIAHVGRPNDKFPAANRVTAINGRNPEELRDRPRFGELTPVFPSEPLKMEHGRDSILGRCIDLVAPIGKGQRGLIVSPPKAGKTTVLKKIAESIAANNPEVHLICLLVDERPEEVTDMQRSIKGEVVASTFDMPCDNHITVAELVIERAKRLVEQGDDVVILLDSITRLARAYNLAQPASGRILSGGVDSTALYPPKRFLGAARNIENGGSLTILASALVDTGSKMDEVIFEEFKGTGNMELKLDRDLADRRIFPAIDPVASGTRKEELLLDPNIAPFVWGIRRILAGMNSNERAMTSLIKSLKATSNNEEFLIRSAKKAQMQEMNGEL